MKTVKRIHDINTSSNFEGDSTFVGLDEYGNEFSVTFDTHELLEWFDKEHAKETLIKLIEEL